MGYHRAGFAVLGVDHAPQPRYPFAFIQADAMEFLAGVKPGEFALIHASPPCQAYSICRNTTGRDRDYPDLVAPVREQLRSIGAPWVIENVVGAPLRSPLLLCGLMFGLKVFRHRLFESSEFLLVPPHAAHGERRIGFSGFCCVAGHGDGGHRIRVDRLHRRKATWEVAMGIDWMSKQELTQAIPPAYTKFIGHQLRNPR